MPLPQEWYHVVVDAEEVKPSVCVPAGWRREGHLRSVKLHVSPSPHS